MGVFNKVGVLPIKSFSTGRCTMPERTREELKDEVHDYAADVVDLFVEPGGQDERDLIDEFIGKLQQLRALA